MENLLSIITLVGGLAFFLYGMTMLGSGLEKISGGKMEKTLEKLTSNVFKSLLLGVLVTAAIQSSSATTVIVVGLVNAGILKLRNAIGVIMGANIGTTVTSVILSLGDLDKSSDAGLLLNLLKPTTFTPIIAVAGLLIFMVAKKDKVKIAGEIMLGFGILFNGMNIMTNAVEPLADSPIFAQLFATLSNPILGILAGTIVTAIIQSSSASVGILQAVASTGVVTYSAAIPIILGQNIGTCVTSLLASIGAKKNAKRAAMVHLYFNIIGTIIFFAVVYIINSTVGFSFWNDKIDMAGISSIHIIFNVATTMLFIPFTGFLEKLACWTVKGDKSQDEEFDTNVAILDDRFLRSPSLALAQCQDVVMKMAEFAKHNFDASIELFTKFDAKKIERIREREDAIDRMEDKLNNYLLKLTDSELTDQESKLITHYLKMVCEFERIGDYSINLVEQAEYLKDKQMSFSPKAISELDAISQAVDEIISMSITTFGNNDITIAVKIEPLEEVIDTMEDALKFKHIQRLKNGKCTIDGGLVFLEILSNLERISDHCSNIAVYIIGYNNDKESLNRHEYLKRIHEGDADDYNETSELYMKKYFSRIQDTENSESAEKVTVNTTL
ncbi:MAG: Na/Pi cotransporter family protein [Oscillospiraceae bacterium]